MSRARLPRLDVTKVIACDNDLMMKKLTYFLFCWIVFFTAFAGIFDAKSQDTKPRNPGENDSDSLVWLADIDNAVEEAKKSGRDMLLVFTGTDWIDICKKFDNDILSNLEFTGPVSKDFVLVKLEYPKVPAKLPGRLETQNKFLKKAYRVRGFPTVLLADEMGRPYAINGIQPLPAKDYGEMVLRIFQAKQKNFDVMKSADKLSGLESATALAKSIPKLPGNLSARFYRPEMDSVIADDPENKTGVVPAYKRLIVDVVYSKQMSKLAGKSEWSKMLSTSDSYISLHGLKGATKQRVLMNKVGVYQRLKNVEGVIGTLLEVVNADPESKMGRNAQKALDKFRADKLEQELLQKKEKSTE